VAVKLLTGSADATMVARFQREARLIAQFHHPHVVGLIDFGEDEGALYLVMEYIDGETLTALLERDGALPEDLVSQPSCCRNIHPFQIKGFLLIIQFQL
jgi:serine/threonine-protein kinase